MKRYIAVTLFGLTVLLPGIEIKLLQTMEVQQPETEKILKQSDEEAALKILKNFGETTLVDTYGKLNKDDVLETNKTQCYEYATCLLKLLPRMDPAAQLKVFCQAYEQSSELATLLRPELSSGVYSAVLSDENAKCTFYSQINTMAALYACKVPYTHTYTPDQQVEAFKHLQRLNWSVESSDDSKCMAYLIWQDVKLEKLDQIRPLGYFSTLPSITQELVFKFVVRNEN